MTPHEFNSALSAVGVDDEGVAIVVTTEPGITFAGRWARIPGTLNLITLAAEGVTRAIDVTRVFSVWTYSPQDLG